MPRYRLVVEYDGSSFTGWQHQGTGRSVQEAVEIAIGRFANEAVRVHCAGRTDSGVHASGQVIHVDLSRAWPPDTVRDATNAHLRPHPVSILEVAPAPDDFHARISAIQRHYRYAILNRRAPPALDRVRFWHVPGHLDANRMAAGARFLLGQHDFTTFRASECQAASPIRTLERLDVSRDGDLICIEAAARSFLHSQVRSIVGTLALAGSGRIEPEGVRDALEARCRSACGPLAPPGGLTLVGVDYPAMEGASA